jgi:hypothetical protein
MIPGPVYIIPCPVCTFTGKKRSLVSGNTFGAELWSDGKQVAWMLPEYPYLVKCKKCGSFFLAKEDNSIGEFSLRRNEADKWPDAEYFDFPSFTEYFEAIGTDIITEKYIRWKAFHSYNDYIRNNREDEITMDMRDLYFDNLKSLLYLLSEDNPKELFSIIEINRQLGRFDKCREFLERITEKDAEELKRLFAEEVEKKNTRLFRLN